MLDPIFRTTSVHRRTLVAGATWSLPAVAMMSAAPAMASSTSGSAAVTGVGQTKTESTVSVPCGRDITYTVIGGGGGANTNYVGGNGAKITGTFNIAAGCPLSLIHI